MTVASNQAALGLLIQRLERIGRLSNAERQAVENLPAKVQTLRPRQDIVREGEKPEHSCLIVEGWAFRYKLLGGGRRQILSFHVPGDVPDLHSLHIDTMDHGLAALTEATIAFIPHESLLDITRRFPGLAGILWREDPDRCGHLPAVDHRHGAARRVRAHGASVLRTLLQVGSHGSCRRALLHLADHAKLSLAMRSVSPACTPTACCRSCGLRGLLCFVLRRSASPPGRDWSEPPSSIQPTCNSPSRRVALG